MHQQTLVKNLDVPAEVQQAIDFVHQLLPSWPRPAIEEELKLRWHYGGQAVLCLKTKQGLEVLAASKPVAGQIKTALESLSPRQRSQAVVYSPDPWDEQEFTLLDPPPLPA